MPATHRRFHFEDFWLRLDGFHDMVATVWNSVGDADPFRHLMLRLQAMARKLTSQSARSVGNVRDKMAISRELILHLDKAQEDRTLSPAESQLRKQLKISYLGLASLDRTIARQRARIANLKDGDANTAFFHQQSTYRRQKNRIFSISDHGKILTGNDEMAEAAYEHFDVLLGTAAERDRTLELSHLIEPCDLQELDAPFGAEEVWNAVKRLPARKALGPDGFTAEFVLACWATVKDDFMAVFQQLFEMRGRGFHCLNQARLTLLPKHADASQLNDYRPIILIPLVAKIFAKVLSLRLAPKLDDLVSSNQNAFIIGRSLHDNFVLVKESARLLHRLGAPRVMLQLNLTHAFDSISWPFLFEVLRQYGFNDRFLDWLAILLSTASTHVMINGKPGPPIWHRHRLRQGDPLSPQHFVLTVDVLARLIRRTIDLGVIQQPS